LLLEDRIVGWLEQKRRKKKRKKEENGEGGPEKEEEAPRPPPPPRGPHGPPPPPREGGGRVRIQSPFWWVNIFVIITPLPLLASSQAALQGTHLLSHIEHTHTQGTTD